MLYLEISGSIQTLWYDSHCLAPGLFLPRGGFRPLLSLYLQHSAWSLLPNSEWSLSHTKSSERSWALPCVQAQLAALGMRMGYVPFASREWCFLPTEATHDCAACWAQQPQLLNMAWRGASCGSYASVLFLPFLFLISGKYNISLFEICCFHICPLRNWDHCSLETSQVSRELQS